MTRDERLLFASAEVRRELTRFCFFAAALTGATIAFLAFVAALLARYMAGPPGA